MRKTAFLLLLSACGSDKGSDQAAVQSMTSVEPQDYTVQYLPVDGKVESTVGFTAPFTCTDTTLDFSLDRRGTTHTYQLKSQQITAETRYSMKFQNPTDTPNGDESSVKFKLLLSCEAA